MSSSLSDIALRLTYGATIVRMSDVALDQDSVALKLRREMAGKTGISSATRLLGRGESAVQSPMNSGDVALLLAIGFLHALPELG
jgi:hypothetical protein